MQACDLFKCISDPQRLRILSLLDAPAVRMPHSEILDAPQVKISKQLAGMKQLGLITARREGTWMIYQLQQPENGLLQANLAYLRSAGCDTANELQADLRARAALLHRLNENADDCPSPVCETIGCCGV